MGRSNVSAPFRDPSWLRKLSFPFSFAPRTRDRNPYTLSWIEGHEHFDQTIDGEAAEVSIAHAGKISSGEWSSLTSFRRRQLLSVPSHR